MRNSLDDRADAGERQAGYEGGVERLPEARNRLILSTHASSRLSIDSPDAYSFLEDVQPTAKAATPR